VAFEPKHPTPDWVIDYWHPNEKAAYPDYFERREKRKAEFIEFWEKNYGGKEKRFKGLYFMFLLKF